MFKKRALDYLLIPNSGGMTMKERKRSEKNHEWREKINHKKETERRIFCS